MIDAILITHYILCFAVLYGVFCRLVRVNHQTKIGIRLGFLILGFSACAGIVEPLRGWLPNIFTISMLAGIVVIQVVTAPRWVDGVPEKFQKGNS